MRCTLASLQSAKKYQKTKRRNARRLLTPQKKWFHIPCLFCQYWWRWDVLRTNGFPSNGQIQNGPPIWPSHNCYQSSVKCNFPTQEHVRTPGLPRTNWSRTVSITQNTQKRHTSSLTFHGAQLWVSHPRQPALGFTVILSRFTNNGVTSDVANML